MEVESSGPWKTGIEEVLVSFHVSWGTFSLTNKWAHEADVPGQRPRLSWQPAGMARMAAGLVQASELKEITSTEVVCRGSEEVGSQTCWTAVVALILILYIYIYIYVA